MSHAVCKLYIGVRGATFATHSAVFWGGGGGGGLQSHSERPALGVWLQESIAVQTSFDAEKMHQFNWTAPP